MNDRCQTQRFELKYRIPPDTADQIRSFVGCYLDHDAFSAQQPRGAYPNHSLYLDSGDLRLYWDVINSNMNRFKLRLRYYDDNPAAPVFFEIKRRVNDSIYKTRAPVRREMAAGLLAGQLPDPRHLNEASSASFAALQEFCRLMLDLEAAPRAHVCYLREAWESKENNAARLTLDTEICAAPHFNPTISTRIEDYCMPFRREVVLELKFSDRFPGWFRELVETFGVTQCGNAKYAESVMMMGEERLEAAMY